MTAPAQLDPRPLYFSAAAWVTDLLRNVDDAQLGDPTPCSEYDVQALAQHLLGTVRRATVIGRGGDFTTVPVTGGEHDADTFAAIVAQARDAWADDASLTRLVAVPWGQVPGGGALWGYLNELLVHGWDLAVATGQPAEADEALVAPVLEAVKGFLPAEIRAGDDVPFDEVVTPRADAGPTEQLANWSGRRPFTR